MATDADGNLYIADAERIRKIASGIITTVAGGGMYGYSGDGGPAASAQLDSPVGLAIDAAGDIYIADQFNNRIRMISNGTITTIAGNGGWVGDLGDNGPAVSATVSNPLSVAVDNSGNIYVSDNGNFRIRKIDSPGVIGTRQRRC